MRNISFWARVSDILSQLISCTIPGKNHPYSNLSNSSSAYFDFHKRYLLYADIHIFTTFPVEIDTIKKIGQNKSFLTISHIPPSPTGARLKDRLQSLLGIRSAHNKCDFHIVQILHFLFETLVYIPLGA